MEIVYDPSFSTAITTYILTTKLLSDPLETKRPLSSRLHTALNYATGILHCQMTRMISKTNESCTFKDPTYVHSYRISTIPGVPYGSMLK